MVKNKPCFEANPVTGRVIRDPETIETILRLHNEIRSKIARGRCGQPIAGCMRPLQWDPELARVAQKWADQCVNVDYRGDKKRKDPHLFHDKHGQRKTGADENSIASCDQILIQTDFITQPPTAIGKEQDKTWPETLLPERRESLTLLN